MKIAELIPLKIKSFILKDVKNFSGIIWDRDSGNPNYCPFEYCFVWMTHFPDCFESV